MKWYLFLHTPEEGNLNRNWFSFLKVAGALPLSPVRATLTTKIVFVAESLSLSPGAPLDPAQGLLSQPRAQGERRSIGLSRRCEVESWWDRLGGAAQVETGAAVVDDDKAYRLGSEPALASTSDGMFVVRSLYTDRCTDRYTDRH